MQIKLKATMLFGVPRMTPKLKFNQNPTVKVQFWPWKKPDQPIYQRRVWLSWPRFGQLPCLNKKLGLFLTKILLIQVISKQN